MRDYQADTIRDMETGEVTATGLPNSNVLYYELPDGAWVCVRPSGTEPKVKFYYGVKGTSLTDADVKSDEMGKAIMEMVKILTKLCKPDITIFKGGNPCAFGIFPFKMNNMYCGTIKRRIYL